MAKKQKNRGAQAGKKTNSEGGETPPNNTGGAIQPSPARAPFPIVGIGASAGGLAALKKFFLQVPEDSGLAFVVVVHLSPEHESHLAELLQPHVKIPVQQVNELIPLEPNCVYIIPPGRNLSTVDTHLRLTPLEERRRERAPIDHFFRTLAATHDGDAIAVILTGTGSDGSLGLREIKQQSGLTIVQDPHEAEFAGMPLSAIATGMADLILPLNEVPQAILNYVRTKPCLPMSSNEEEAEQDQRQLLQKVFAQLRSRTGRDFSRYKISTILRRIQRRMQLRQIIALHQYLDVLRTQKEEALALSEDLLITVTNFFRDHEVFQAIEELLPDLLATKGPQESLRVWSVGCSTGEEAYSLTMLLIEAAEKLQAPPRIQVFASDLHENSLIKARDGFYPGEIETDVSPQRLERFFQKEERGYRIRKEIREIIVFAPHNLLGDPPFSRLDLIVCRNVLIYFQREVQKNVIDLFHYALLPSGYLVLGTSETIDGRELFQVENKKACIFRKRNVPPPEPRLPVFPVSHLRWGGFAESAPAAFEPVAYGAMHTKMVEEYAPPSILVSPDDKVVHLSQHAGRYLVHPGGELTASAIKLIREELRLELRSALHRVRERREPFRSQPIVVCFSDGQRPVVLNVRPALGHQQEGFCLVIFDEQEASVSAQIPKQADSSSPSSDESGRCNSEMEAELEMTHQRLHGLIEEFEASQEEMKASNEELQSANEELRSTLEELETSKEELQSMNEELQTVNQENRLKVEELAQLSGDLQNLLAATDIATLFLDREMRVLRFTPKIGELFNIRAVDRGRPISDLTHRLGYDHLLLDAQAVLDKLQPIEREVQDLEGHWYFTRVLPYRSTEDRIEGIVLTFIEITERKHSEEALRQSEEALRQLNQRLEQQVFERTSMVKLLQDITRTANESRTFDEAICQTMDRILQLGRWQFGRVWRRELDDTACIKSAFLGYHSPSPQAASLSPEKQRAIDQELDARADELTKQVLATQEPQWGQWLQQKPDEEIPAKDSHGEDWTAIAFPIVTDHEIRAILQFFSPTPEEPEKQLLEILPDIGIQLGHVVKRKELEKLVADAAEREQRRIGRDIHDGVGQELTGLRHLAHTHAEQLQKMNLPESKVAFRVADGFKTVQQQLRSIIRDLIPVEVDSEGLVAALRGLAERTTQLHNIPCSFRATKPLAIKNTLMATHIYRIAQEAVSNAIKHAHAKEILIELYEAHGNLILRILDDGIGFSTSRPTHDCYGIRTMSFRAELLGGHLRMSQRPQGGTEVHCAVPFTKSLSQESDG